MPIVKMPDGVLVNMPDAPSEEQLQALASIPKAPAAEPSYGDRVLDNLKFGATSLAKGAMSLPALIGDGLNAAAEHIPGVSAAVKIARTATGTKAPEPFALSNAVQSIGPKPETSGGRWVDAGLQALGGGLAGPGAIAAPIRTAVTSVGAGLGGELGKRVLPQSEVLGGLAGGLAGGIGAGTAAGFAARIRPATGAVAREAIEGITPEQLAKAQAFMNQSAQQMPPVRMDLAQALEATGVAPGNLSTVRDLLANKTQGTKVQDILRGQPSELNVAASERVSGLPGPTWAPTVAANQVQKAATDTVQAAKNSRTAAVRPLYEQAGPVSEETRTALMDKIQSILQAPGTTDEIKAKGLELMRKFSGKPAEAMDAVEQARGLLDSLAENSKASARLSAQQRLAEANAALNQTTTTPLHALDIDTAIGEASGKFKGTPLTPTDPKTFGQGKYLTGGLNQVLQDGSPQVKQAENLYRQISQDVVDPLKQGPVGQLATPRGYKPDVQASAAKLDHLFKTPGDPLAKTSDIRDLATGLKAVDPEAFPAAAKAFLRGQLNTAFESSLGGEAGTSGKAASNVYNSLFKTQGQWKSMQDIVSGIADSYGLPPAQRDLMVKGMENLGMTVRGLANRPQSIGGMDKQQLTEMAGKNRAAYAVRMAGFMPFAKAADDITNLTMGKTLRQFDDLLTSPEGAKILMELAKVPPLSNAAVTILGTFSGSVPGVEESWGRQ